MGYLIAILFSYLLGCSSMAFYLGKLKKTDFSRNGSGNLGASNVTILIGWGPGILVAIHDIGKAVIAVLLAQWMFPELQFVGAAAGVACILGHIFPFYLGFKGGKGLASYIGMTLALDWRAGLVVVVLLVLATFITDYIVAGTMTTIVAAPVAIGIARGSLIMALIPCIATAVMVFKHLENFQRIRSGVELGLRTVIRGDYRRE